MLVCIFICISSSIFKKIYYNSMFNTINYQKKVINHFNKKKICKLGFLKYSFFSRKINYIYENQLSNYEIRKIFNSLVEDDYFYKLKNRKRSYLYEYKNKTKTKDYYRANEPITLIFE
jgi:hypothetical protein